LMLLVTSEDIIFNGPGLLVLLLDCMY